MSRADDLRMLDILDAAERIGRITGRGRDTFDKDEVIQPALERLLGVIGESANAMSDEARSSVPHVPRDDVQRLRILLAHHYHRVDSHQVWAMSTTNVSATAIRASRPDLKL